MGSINDDAIKIASYWIIFLGYFNFWSLFFYEFASLFGVAVNKDSICNNNMKPDLLKIKVITLFALLTGSLSSASAQSIDMSGTVSYSLVNSSTVNLKVSKNSKLSRLGIRQWNSGASRVGFKEQILRRNHCWLQTSTSNAWPTQRRLLLG